MDSDAPIRVHVSDIVAKKRHSGVPSREQEFNLWLKETWMIAIIKKITNIDKKSCPIGQNLNNDDEYVQKKRHAWTTHDDNAQLMV